MLLAMFVATSPAAQAPWEYPSSSTLLVEHCATKVVICLVVSTTPACSEAKIGIPPAAG